MMLNVVHFGRLYCSLLIPVLAEGGGSRVRLLAGLQIDRQEGLEIPGLSTATGPQLLILA
jgi:hypothetical protein